MNFSYLEMLDILASDDARIKVELIRCSDEKLPKDIVEALAKDDSWVVRWHLVDCLHAQLTPSSIKILVNDPTEAVRECFARVTRFKSYY
jgi:hypothetical protein